jgi:hypothetical protein
MTATIVNPKYDPGIASLVTPPGYGYLLLGATVAPPSGPPLVRPDATRQSVLTRVSQELERVTRLEAVVRATAYRAVLIPPARAPDFRPDLEAPRFDVTVLVETDSPDSLADVATSASVTSMRDVLQDSASRVKEMRARCTKAIADVDKRPSGTYLFNYWAAADTATALDLFDHLATWFQANTGLRNSTVLQPLGDDEFAFVNHARWDAGLLSVATHLFLRPSFYSFVRPNLAANHIQLYPALYRRFANERGAGG